MGSKNTNLKAERGCEPRFGTAGRGAENVEAEDTLSLGHVS